MAIEILPDDRALRVGRRERVLAQMHAHDLDVLIAGRQANARYLSGAPQLWVAGTRPFGPVALRVRRTGAVHLHSTWDEGIPEEIPHENLYETMWDPRNLVAVLRDIDGAADARRVGTDALSPGFAELLPTAFPNAEIVDGDQITLLDPPVRGGPPPRMVPGGHPCRVLRGGGAHGFYY